MDEVLPERPASAADSLSSKDSVPSNGRPDSASNGRPDSASNGRPDSVQSDKPHSKPNSRRSSRTKSTDMQNDGDAPFDPKAGGDGVTSVDMEKGVKFQKDVYSQSESGSEVDAQNVSDSKYIYIKYSVLSILSQIYRILII